MRPVNQAMKYLIAVALAALAAAGCSSSASHPAAGHTSAVSAPNPDRRA